MPWFNLEPSTNKIWVLTLRAPFALVSIFSNWKKALFHFYSIPGLQKTLHLKEGSGRSETQMLYYLPSGDSK